jgi:hypothetical protein
MSDLLTQDVLAGDYGVVDTPGTIDGIIRFGDEGPMNPAFTVLETTRLVKDSGGHWQVATGGTLSEAGGKGMVYGDLRYYLEHARHIAFSNDSLTAAQREVIVLEAKREVDDKVPYGYFDIVLLGLARLGIHWGWLHRRLEAAHLLICSQAVARQYRLAGVVTMPKHADIDVTPETLHLRAGVQELF